MQLHRCCSWRDGMSFWAVYTGTRPGVAPANWAGKGWRGRRELAPRCSATRIRCIVCTRQDRLAVSLIIRTTHTTQTTPRETERRQKTGDRRQERGERRRETEDRREEREDERQKIEDRREETRREKTEDRREKTRRDERDKRRDQKIKRSREDEAELSYYLSSVGELI